MKILHTSDWHLGKQLEGNSRINEQELFLLELENICNDKGVDLIVIAGDIYDSVNPSAEAEKLFFSSVSRLSLGGKRPILIIAGNHDSPERLIAASPLALEMGIILFGTSKTIIPTGNYVNFEVVDSGCGFIELKIKDENIIALTMPYPSERRLNELISSSMDEEEMQKSYSDKVKEIFNSVQPKFRDDTINIVVAHLYVTGGVESGSERSIQLGGSLAVDPSVFPQKAQYIALGHLHRPQKACGLKNAYYSGSPIQYNKSEITYAKIINLVDISPNNEAKIEKIYLHNYKPIELWEVNSVEDAITKCSENTDKNCWVYLDIHTKNVLDVNEIKKIKSLKEDIIEIRPIFDDTDYSENISAEEEKSITEHFRDFYFENRGVLPADDVLELFLNIVNSGEV